MKIEKEEIKFTLFADDMILYIENPKDATRKLIELNSEINKVAVYKTNIQIPHAFLYTKNEKSEREIKETVPFIISTKRIKFLSLRTALVAQLVKNLPAVQETWAWSLVWEDPLEKRKATHSSILTWRILWAVQSMGLQRVGHNWVTFTSLPKHKLT